MYYYSEKLIKLIYKKSFMNVNNSENYNNKKQSAGNWKRTSETICPQAIDYVAGVIDGDGNFDIRSLNGKKKLKAIRVKLDIRDISILSRIKHILKCGRIKYNKNLVTYVVSTFNEMYKIIYLLNGRIRLKVTNFVESCIYFNIDYKKAVYNIDYGSRFYFLGLIDTDGSVIFNYSSNRIELHLELKKNDNSILLNLDNVIPSVKPRVNYYKKRNQNRKKIYYSVRFSFDTVKDMEFLYHFFKRNRLYCTFKFYRLMKIKTFLKVRNFKNFRKHSPEHIAYSNCVKDFISYLNSNYMNLPYYKELS